MVYTKKIWIHKLLIHMNITTSGLWYHKDGNEITSRIFSIEHIDMDGIGSMWLTIGPIRIGCGFKN